ncbi:MAG TPA: SMI1/KNR4 family protein [Gemmatimonadales bacterium]|nr:SMI1/KNR4 family protein [Gemmatimonadales bacterium]
MLADTLRSLAGLRLTDAAGKSRALELLPPATPDQMARLEAALPGPLPDEIRDALLVTTGLAHGPLEAFSLIDLEGFGLEEAFPCPWSVAHDGFGNYWILDLLPGAPDWGPVYYACHDPAVIAWQAASLEDFLLEVVALWQPGRRSAVSRVRDEVVHRLWREDVASIDPRSDAAAADQPLREFAATLPIGARLSDLRRAGLGDGFVWGRFGPRTEVRRAGNERVWAAIPPEKRPGLFRRLFGSTS